MVLLDERKEVKDSLLEKATTIANSLGDRRALEGDFETEFTNSILEAISQTRIPYELSIAETRSAYSIEEIAEIWRDTYATYQAIRAVWAGVFYILNTPKNKVLRYWGELIEKLEQASLEHLEFHS